jgi:outer membrane receptor protein involved in Fe transport
MRLAQRMYGGFEFMRRNLDVPIFDNATGAVFFEDEREDLNRAYFYFTPDRHWALSAEYQFESFRRKDFVVLPLPRRVDTTIIPFTVGYFSAIDPARPAVTRGLFARLSATFVKQNVRLSAFSTFPQDREKFWVVDASVGYRLPKRRGIASLEVKNLLDEQFLFQDSNIQNLEPTTPRFTPTRTLFLRVSLNF